MSDAVLVIRPRVWRAVTRDILIMGVSIGVAYVLTHARNISKGDWESIGVTLQAGVWATVAALGLGLVFAFGWAEARRRVGTIRVTETDIVGPNGGWIVTSRSKIPCAELRPAPPLVREGWDRVLFQSRITTVRGDRSIVVYDGYYDKDELASLFSWLAAHSRQ